MIAGIELFAYRLPLREPWVSARGTLSVRCGWILRLRDGVGREGLGDCAPLPGAGTETAGRALEALARARAWKGREPEACLQALEADTDCPPAARCALETALGDLAARRAGLPLCRWLAPGAADSIAVNAMIGAADRGLIVRGEGAVARGYRVLKVKLGCGPLDEELAAVADLARALGQRVALRLDANRAWDQATAAKAVAALARLAVEALEEPLAAPDPPALAELQARSPFPITLDESLPAIGLDAVLRLRPVRRVVLKPMVWGGIARVIDAARRARDAGLEWTVTTTVDSAVGTLAAAHAAAALPGELAHGLGTSAWLSRDLAEPPDITGGRLSLSSAPGLGCGPLASAPEIVAPATFA